MKFIGFIPARKGSKGLPGKNKKLLNGKPLIAYTIEAAIEAGLKEIIVSTDDIDILEICSQYGIHGINRPPELASDSTPTLPVLQHAINLAREEFDAVITLQPTSPLRTSHHIIECMDIFASSKKADSLVSITKAPHKFVGDSLMVLNGDFVEPIRQDIPLTLRRQDKPIFYGRNGAAIYITAKNKISEFIFGGNILAYEMSKSESIDIDDIEDWKMAEALLIYNNLKNNVIS